jgi:hypothetical protein
MQPKPTIIALGRPCDYPRLPSVDISEGGPKRNLGTEALSRAEPEVRIHLPPADSPSRARIRYQESRTPAFRAGVRGWLGDRVGRDAQGVSISRQPAAISLSGHIPVPRCR